MEKMKSHYKKNPTILSNRQTTTDKHINAQRKRHSAHPGKLPPKTRPVLNDCDIN